jgi:hypothetical protein
VEEVLEHRGSGRNMKFLVRWKGYGPEHNTWEPLRHLKNASEVLAEYYAKVGAQPQAKMAKRARKRNLSRLEDQQ